MNKILLDTNAYVKLLEGNQIINSYLVESEIIFFPSVAIGELFSGFYGGTRLKENKKILENFISKPSVQVSVIGTETAEIYGEIKSELKKQGTPIPINDIWIAACAIENGAKLITYDKHFLNIQGLRLWEEIKK